MPDGSRQGAGRCRHTWRRRVEIDLPAADETCACGHTRTRIGDAVTEKLKYEPASLVIVETVRPKYACPSCHTGVMEAPRHRRRSSGRSRRRGSWRMSW